MMGAENLFLGAFAYPCKRASQLRYVCTSARLCQGGTYWTDFREI